MSRYWVLIAIAHSVLSVFSPIVLVCRVASALRFAGSCLFLPGSLPCARFLLGLPSRLSHIGCPLSFRVCVLCFVLGELCFSCGLVFSRAVFEVSSNYFWRIRALILSPSMVVTLGLHTRFWFKPFSCCSPLACGSIRERFVLRLRQRHLFQMFSPAPLVRVGPSWTHDERVSIKP